MRYGPDFFFEAIVEFIRHQIDGPTLVIGAGVTAGFVPEAALRLGNSVRGIVLIAPPEPEGPRVIETATWRPLLYQLLRSPIGTTAVRWSSSRGRRRAVLARDLAAEAEGVDDRAEVLHRNARQKAAGWPLWSLWAGDLAWDPRAALSRLGAPALVLWGAEARVNAAAPDTYHAVRPDLTQDVIPGTARWPHVDDDETVSERILEWWETATRAGGHEEPV
jgi:pimeloyl-ACP methyl ester carboxylesterase